MGSQAGSTGQSSTTLMHQRHMGNEHGELALKLHTNFQMNNVGLDSGWLQLGNDNRHSQVDNSGSCLSRQREHDLSFDALVSTSIPRNNSEESNYLSSKWQGRYSVDLLNAGRIVAGNAWCNKDAIFPAGNKSAFRIYKNDSRVSKGTTLVFVNYVAFDFCKVPLFGF